jgi:hypothetical protein
MGTQCTPRAISCVVSGIALHLSDEANARLGRPSRAAYNAHMPKHSPPSSSGHGMVGGVLGSPRAADAGADHPDHAEDDDLQDPPALL